MSFTNAFERGRNPYCAVFEFAAPHSLNVNFAGGSPAAGYFLCTAKESNQRKAAPGSPALRAALRCSAALRGMACDHVL